MAISNTSTNTVDIKANQRIRTTATRTTARKSTMKETLKLALEALEYHTAQTRPIEQTNEAIAAIKEALAQPDQKYRRGNRLICLETEEYCVIHISGTDRQWVKFPDSHVGVYTNEQVAELFELLPKEPEQEPVANGLPLVIAGAIFDFAGYLTTREIVIEVGSTANASPVADLLKDWAALRGLSLADAAVLSWQEWLTDVHANDTLSERVDEMQKQRHDTTPPQRKPLTDEIPKGVLLAISNAGLTLLKTQHGYELKKLGHIEAVHGIKG